MKNKKFKLFASLTSLVMVVAVMAVGVWAATQASVTAQGTASFNAVGIAATVKVDANSQIKGTSTQDILTVTVAQANPAAGNWDFNIAYTNTDANENGSLVTVTKTLTFKIEKQAGSGDAYFQVAPATLSAQDKQGKDAVIEITGIVVNDGQSTTETVKGALQSESTATPATIVITYTVTAHNGAALSGTNTAIAGFSISLKNVAF